MRAKLVAASAIIWLGCDQGAAPRRIDPCSLVSNGDASAVFDQRATRLERHQNECVWTYDFPDRSSWSLRVKVGRFLLQKPIIIVTKSEITYRGRPVEPATKPEPRVFEPISIGEDGFLTATESLGISVRWIHEDNLVDLTLAASGPSAPKVMPRVEHMKQLARKVDAALGAQGERSTR